MEKEYAPETYEEAEAKLLTIKHRCKMSPETEPELLNALLDYYETKKTDPTEASKLWGEVQQILDTCDLK